MYKLHILEQDNLITSYNSPIIPKHNERIHVQDSVYKVKRLGYIVYKDRLAELNIFVEKI